MRIIESIFYGIFYPILGAGVVVYVIYAIANVAKGGTPSFELAIISAVLGGFALSGGFLEQASSGLKRHIRRIGVLYLGAAIFFTVFALVIPMAKVETVGVAYWVVFLANLISMFFAVLFFTLATALLIAKLPKLLQEFWGRN